MPRAVSPVLPFDELHRGVEAFMGRPVWTHEFVDPERLRRERNGETVADPLQMSPWTWLGVTA